MEASAAARLPLHTLMQRAGLAVAKFAMAVAPHAKVIWIPSGPGNNGGDGYEAATHLKSWGKSPIVTCLSGLSCPPPDAALSLRQAMEAGVEFSDTAPDHYDLCIDALFGVGRLRPADGLYATWIHRINTRSAPVLAVDTPSGLDADTGLAAALHVKADYTLSLLTLKPGLLTADGREACGEIWLNTLGIDPPPDACARLSRRPTAKSRAHNSHKGSYGDVCIVGGNPGMAGAALLAARAAIRSGAGRVFVSMIDNRTIQLDASQPELMFRDLSEVNLGMMTIVAGCGGGRGIQALLPKLLAQSARLVLDADALNAIAIDPSLQSALAARPVNTTVLTPHPLEAARLVSTTTAEVQANRLITAQAIADRFACVVALKGSGTLIAAPGALPYINTTGNGRLATAGTGDVLAGMIGARFSTAADAFLITCESAFHHGEVADKWPDTLTLSAQDLTRAL